MKKIYLSIILLAVCVFSFPGRASALAMQLTVHIGGIKVPERGASLWSGAFPPDTNLDFALEATTWLAVWQDANKISGSTADIKNGAGPQAYAATSSTSILGTMQSTISTGIPTSFPSTKTFTGVPSGLPIDTHYSVRARATEHNNSNNWMEGFVTSYSGGSLTIYTDSSSGTGTYGSAGDPWDIVAYRSITNSTSVTSEAFTVPAGLPYTTASRLRISKHSDNRNWMEGYVNSYSGTSLVVDVDSYGGAGYLASSDYWDIFSAPVLLTPQASATNFKIPAGYPGWSAGTVYLAGDLYNQGNLVAAGDETTVNFNYSSGHTYSAYIGIIGDNCGIYNNPQADCTLPAITPGSRSCAVNDLVVTSPATTTAGTVWKNAACANYTDTGGGSTVPEPNNGSANIFIYLGQNAPTYPVDEKFFYIFLQQLYP